MWKYQVINMYPANFAGYIPQNICNIFEFKNSMLMTCLTVYNSLIVSKNNHSAAVLVQYLPKIFGDHRQPKLTNARNYSPYTLLTAICKRLCMGIIPTHETMPLPYFSIKSRTSTVILLVFSLFSWSNCSSVLGWFSSSYRGQPKSLQRHGALLQLVRAAITALKNDHVSQMEHLQAVEKVSIAEQSWEQVPFLANLRWSTRRVSDSYYPIKKQREHLRVLRKLSHQHSAMRIRHVGSQRQAWLIPISETGFCPLNWYLFPWLENHFRTTSPLSLTFCVAVNSRTLFYS